MKRYLSFVLLLSILSGCSVFKPQPRNTFMEEMTTSPSHKISERIIPLSEPLLGLPYVDGGLGEGLNGQFDRDPLSRFDLFDCTTFVETVLAGAMSYSPSEFERNLIKLRYQHGNVDFITRNHFASADWIPNNQWALRDITQDIALDHTAFAETLIDKPAWYQAMQQDRLQGLPDSIDKTAQLKALHEAGKNLPKIYVRTPYVPLTALNQPEVLDRIPSGSVISMVRPNYDVSQWIGTHLNITHQAFAIRKQGKLFLRHASLRYKKVVDEGFVEYFSQYDETSTLKGFNVQQPIEQALVAGH